MGGRSGESKGRTSVTYGRKTRKYTSVEEKDGVKIIRTKIRYYKTKKKKNKE